MTVPTRLRLEHLPPGQPCGAERPRGSWLLPAGTARQHAYALRLLDADVLWESGRRACSESVLVDLDAPRIGRSWQVTVWTDQGGSDWSVPAPWTVTTLPPLLDDAVWIEPHEPEIAPPGERPAHRLQRTFTLDVAGATAWATAHGIYELFVNGHRVGDEELTPGFTAYRARLLVQAHDVGALLHRGRNDVEILLSDGWFRGRHGFERHADGFGTRTAALLAVEVHLADRSIATVTTGDGWWSQPSGIHADLMDGQATDLRASGEAHPARPVHRRASLELSVAPPVRRIEELAPVEVRRISPTCTVVDFGQNINGWVRLGDLGPAGTMTTLTHGEMLAADGRVTTENLRALDFRTGQRLPAGQVDSVVASGRPGEGFEPRHTTHGFRYVQLDGAPATHGP